MRHDGRALHVHLGQRMEALEFKLTSPLTVKK